MMAEVPEHTLHNLQDLQTDAGRMLEGVTLLPKITQSATACLSNCLKYRFVDPLATSNLELHHARVPVSSV